VEETFLYADFLADFRGEFHDIRGDPRFAKCLAPNSLKKESAGLVFPSVRHSGGTCIACFRPALVNNVRSGDHVSVQFENSLAAPVIRPVYRS